MDRRQKKSRNAIFNAFISLLSKRDFSKITVGDIIEKADVGRATFYAHFETKDFLLRELCKELFDHVFESDLKLESAHNHIFDCDAPDSVFLHLFEHLKKNDNHIADLLISQNNDLFLTYFKESLTVLIANQLEHLKLQKPKNLPEHFWINNITSTFIETAKLWISGKMKESTKTITEYFYTCI